MQAKHKMKADAPPLHAVYHELHRAWGPQHWWPGRTRFEMIAGAILTQNTAWTNVEKALRRLRREGVLQPERMRRTDPAVLADWIRPAGYFNLKARRLQAFTQFLAERFDGSLNRLFRLDTETLRAALLSVNGIGPETADSIVLYAGHRPSFVIDAYTRRMLVRHGWAAPHATYDELAALFTRALPRETRLYNEYHALLVRLGKDYCKPTPQCAACPLRHRLPKPRTCRG